MCIYLSEGSTNGARLLPQGPGAVSKTYCQRGLLLEDSLQVPVNLVVSCSESE